MRRVVDIGRERGAQLNRPRRFVLELPEWLIRIVELRAPKANEGTADDPVSITDVMEWSLVAPITLKYVPAYETAIPGVTAALSRWLESATYDPGD
ncbi:MAG: hypothetical protein JWN02_1263 [Acidobacteria bacterium]|nr:hypothetical protein [Acidobacteriota bacterium]